jgi:hypothetical protein
LDGVIPAMFFIACTSFASGFTFPFGILRIFQTKLQCTIVTTTKLIKTLYRRCDDQLLTDGERAE